MAEKMNPEEEIKHRIDDAMGGIWHNNPSPRWATKVSNCCQPRCLGIARGGGKCAGCYERDLACLTHSKLAREFHEAVKEVRRLEKECLEKCV